MTLSTNKNPGANIKVVAIDKYGKSYLNGIQSKI